jgi:Lrp/AsnC family leucine-responsive transcriptional regulator
VITAVSSVMAEELARPPLDAVDQELLTALVHDGRLTYQQLAREVHMSANAAADRVRRLRQSGVVSGYHAVIDLPAVGYHMGALSDVKLRDEVEREDFEGGLDRLPQVLEAIHTTGEYDYQLRLACSGTLDLEWVVDSLRGLGCREVHSRIILSRRAYDPTRLLRRRGAGGPVAGSTAG